MRKRLIAAVLALVGGVVSASAQTQVTPPSTNYTFQWSAPTGPEPVDRYEWRIQPGPDFVSVGAAKSVNLPALANGSYTAAVRACNTGGCGPAPTLAFVVGTQQQTQAPGMPQGLQLVAMAPPATAAYRSHTLTSYASRSGNTAVVKPTGTVDGDYVLLAFVAGAAPNPNSTITPPPGFIQLSGFPSSQAAGGFRVDLRVYYRLAAGEPATYTFTHSGAALATQAMAIAVSGVSGVPAVTINKGVGTTGTATGLSAPANALVLFLEHNWDLYGSEAPPTGSTPTFTERSDLASSLLYLASGNITAAGATGNKSHANGNNGSGGWQSLLIALAPQ